MTRPNTDHWPRTARGKLICPECGQTGWPYTGDAPSWLDKHSDHVDCDCGKRVTRSGLAAHRRHHPDDSSPGVDTAPPTVVH